MLPVTVTAAEPVAEPPEPVQVIEYDVLALGCFVTVPLVVVPTPVHEVALVEDQVMVVLPPAATVVGLAAMFTVGAGPEGAVTVTILLSVAVPPAPVQVIEYVVVTVGDSTTLPVVVVPIPVHAVASVEDHAIVLLPPVTTVSGVAVSVTVGGVEVEVTVMILLSVAVPPAPVQEIE